MCLPWNSSTLIDNFVSLFQVEEVSLTAANSYQDAVYKSMYRYLDVGFAADFTFHGTKGKKEFKKTMLAKYIECKFKLTFFYSFCVF